MALKDASVAHLTELITTVRRAEAFAADEDKAELEEVAMGLQELKDQKLVDVKNRVRTYVAAALRRTFLESQAAAPDVTADDVAGVAATEVPDLLAHLPAVLDGSLTS